MKIRKKPYVPREIRQSSSESEILAEDRRLEDAGIELELLSAVEIGLERADKIARKVDMGDNEYIDKLKQYAPRIVTLYGPPGVGKSTVMSLLDNEEDVTILKRRTNRPPRQSEEDDILRNDFIASDTPLEEVEVMRRKSLVSSKGGGEQEYYYWFDAEDMHKKLSEDSSTHVFMWTGCSEEASVIKHILPESKSILLTTPPEGNKTDEEVLIERLGARGDESERRVSDRIPVAKYQLAKGRYFADYVVANPTGEPQKAAQRIIEILHGGRLPTLAHQSGRQISASILSADFGNLEHAVRLAEEAGCDQIHLDVIDDFAGLPGVSHYLLKSLRHRTKLPFDLHFAVHDPRPQVDSFVDAGANTISIHVESGGSIGKAIQTYLSDSEVQSALGDPSRRADALKPVMEAERYCGKDTDLSSLIEGSEGLTNKFLCTVRDMSTEYVLDTLRHINSKTAWNGEKVKSGLAIETTTSVDNLTPEMLQEADMVMFMGAPAGGGGRGFQEGVLEKVRTLRERIEEGGYETQIEFDGGVNLTNLSKVVGAGASIVVAGSFVFGKHSSPGVNVRVRSLRQLMEE